MLTKHVSKPATAALLAVCATLTGCASPWFASQSEPAPVVQPGDFIGEARAQADGTPEEQPNDVLVSQGTAQAAEDAAPKPTGGTRSHAAMPMDAMVGHINGEAVYADQIFDVNLVAQLESFGRRYDSPTFRKNALPVIQERLQGIIINKLILGEAERNLKEAQRRGIDARIQAEREELLRFYGQGSLAKAKAMFREDRDKDLEQHLVDFREELIIRSYIQSRVFPKIVVNQRDIERYYADHLDQYQQPDTRVIRLIRAVDASTADQLKTRLDKGQAFDQLAANAELNQFNPTNAGIFMSGAPQPGDEVIGLEPVNEALLPLKTGEHAGPIVVGDKTYFVQAVERNEGVTIELADAQINIEQILRTTQFERHALTFRRELYDRGSFSNETDMLVKLLDIAAARYDQ